MPRLLVIKGADEGKQFELADAQVSIGRESSNLIRLHDTEVSRRHAEFRQVDGGYALVDKGSSNGIFVNNQKVQEALLKAGDQILIGQTMLVYSTGRADDQAAVHADGVDAADAALQVCRDGPLPDGDGGGAPDECVGAEDEKDH